jgi:hypothetical protein
MMAINTWVWNWEAARKVWTPLRVDVKETLDCNSLVLCSAYGRVFGKFWLGVIAFRSRNSLSAPRGLESASVVVGTSVAKSLKINV